MKNYGREHERRGSRGRWADMEDIHHLGLPSRYGKSRVGPKKSTRRLLKKVARLAAKRAIYQEMS